MTTAEIKYIVVLMLENRSYDNVLGGVYLDPSNPAPEGQSKLDGVVLNSVQQSNVDPTSSTAGLLYMQAATNTTVPAIDPGEPFEDMAQQIWGLSKKASIGENPTVPGPLGMMGGFTTNYVQQGTGGNAQDVMTYLTPDQIPVTAFLAKNFAVSDQWFGSVPTHTYANRAFAHCGGPGVIPPGHVDAGKSFLNDADYYLIHPTDFGFNTVALPSIFDQLELMPLPSNGMPPWKIYFHDLANALILQKVYNCSQSETNVNVGTVDDSDWGSGLPKSFNSVASSFVTDIANNTLAPYSFIEPRYLSNYAPTKVAPNSNHPGVGKLPSIEHYAPTDVTNGEILLATVYNALVKSSLWPNTLLIVTYDEHGGLYDHVSPPQTATEPGPSVPPARFNGYPFNSFGPRVPALIISPWVPAGSTVRPVSVPFDHTTIIKTVWETFNLSTPTTPYLTLRDNAAESVLPALSLTSASNNPGPVAVPTALKPAPSK